MTLLVFYMVVFLVVGVFFLFFHLMIGKLIRPAKPDPEKLTIYECGEPTVGSAWVQFDLRYYVVALLFVIFDVEVAFFFPWAVVFGKANTLANEDLKPEIRAEISRELTTPGYLPLLPGQGKAGAPVATVTPEAARQWGWIAFWDILVFFGVLLVGFAYLWKRGDIDWVRSTLAERPGGADGDLAGRPAPTVAPEERVLAGSGRGL